VDVAGHPWTAIQSIERIPEQTVPVAVPVAPVVMPDRPRTRPEREAWMRERQSEAAAPPRGAPRTDDPDRAGPPARGPAATHLAGRRFLVLRPGSKVASEPPTEITVAVADPRALGISTTGYGKPRTSGRPALACESRA